MIYTGSKARLVTEIVPIIHNIIYNHDLCEYYEPFVGGANVIPHVVAEQRVGSDINKYVIALLKEAQKGNMFDMDTSSFSKERYDMLRKNPEQFDVLDVAIYAYLLSYNCSWFNGYIGEQNMKKYFKNNVNSLIGQADMLLDIDFKVMDYRALNVSGAIIYCDPPYKDTKQYSVEFEHDLFWEWVREQSKKNYVLVSEIQAPKDFRILWETSVNYQGFGGCANLTTERLFVSVDGLLGDWWYEK